MTRQGDGIWETWGDSREDWVRVLARRRERLAVFAAQPGMEELAAEAQALVEAAERRVAEFDEDGEKTS